MNSKIPDNAMVATLVLDAAVGALCSVLPEVELSPLFAAGVAGWVDVVVLGWMTEINDVLAGTFVIVEIVLIVVEPSRTGTRSGVVTRKGDAGGLDVCELDVSGLDVVEGDISGEVVASTLGTREVVVRIGSEPGTRGSVARSNRSLSCQRICIAGPTVTEAPLADVVRRKPQTPPRKSVVSDVQVKPL